jgi:hypothetical protein
MRDLCGGATTHSAVMFGANAEEKGADATVKRGEVFLSIVYIARGA